MALFTKFDEPLGSIKCGGILGYLRNRNEYQVSHRYNYFSWWWAHSLPKHVEKRNKHAKKNFAISWLYLQDYTGNQGQQNLHLILLLSHKTSTDWLPATTVVCNISWDEFIHSLLTSLSSFISHGSTTSSISWFALNIWSPYTERDTNLTGHKEGSFNDSGK